MYDRALDYHERAFELDEAPLSNDARAATAHLWLRLGVRLRARRLISASDRAWYWEPLFALARGEAAVFADELYSGAPGRELLLNALERAARTADGAHLRDHLRPCDSGPRPWNGRCFPS